MKKETIIFDNSNPMWEENFEKNLMFVKYQARNIRDIFIRRGYIYLNQVYEYLLIEWNPYNKNCAILNTKNNKFDILISTNYEDKDKIKIVITW